MVFSPTCLGRTWFRERERANGDFDSQELLGSMHVEIWMSKQKDDELKALGIIYSLCNLEIQIYAVG